MVNTRNVFNFSIFYLSTLQIFIPFSTVCATLLKNITQTIK